MKTRVSPAVVGVFVIGALLLGVVGLLSFGGVNFFSKPQRFVVYFDEPVQGLDLGSPVKLRGVRVGRVADINVHYNAADNSAAAAVVCELSRSVVTGADGRPLDLSNRQELETLVAHGLRAQLGVMGLATGLLYVELDFVDPRQYPPNPRVADARYLVVPSIPSAIAEFTASVSDILSNLKKVDFAGLSKELTALLATARGKLDALDTAKLSAEWIQAGQSVNALAQSPELKASFANLNAALTELRGLVANLNGQVKPNGEKLQRTLAQAQQALAAFNSAADTLRRFLNAQSGLGEESAQALQQIGDAAAAVKQLADFLQRNPNALLTGRAPPANN